MFSPSLARCTALLSGVLLASASLAQSPAALHAGWSQMARSQDPGFAPSAARGRSFYERQFQHNADMPGCTACHTSNPRQPGRHVITSKALAPLSPLAHPQRFTDSAKTEKWFKRNCNDVAGRECTAAEKADLLEFLLKGTP
jgi:hypothetical protein